MRATIHIRLLLALLIAVGVVGATLSLTQAQAANGVYDSDGDKLIEISYLEQLDAIRYDPNGDGTADDTGDATAYAAAFPVGSGQSVCVDGCNGYELLNDLNFGVVGSYRSGAVNTAWTTGNGWTPIIHREATDTTSAKGYKAIFEGNGHTISSLYSKGSSNNRDTGLFALVESSGAIRSLKLTGVSIVGGYANTGSLVANNKGSISDSSSVGSVTGKGDVGGLVGNNTGSIAGSSSAGTVTGTEDYVGGLAGDNIGTITFSHADVTVSGGGDYVGGLAGYNLGTITYSYASGAVTGKDDYVGGLLGKNGSTVTSSYADGSVSGAGIVTDAGNYVGGLIGDNIGTVSVSYAAGAVSGAGDYVGGLAGDNSGTVRRAYAIGDVAGDSSVGGLIGDNAATVKYAFSASCGVTGTSSTGGLIGANASTGTTVTDSYWDTTIGPSTSAAGTGKTTSELQTPTGYTGIYANWQSGDEGDVWDFGTASEYPALEADLNDDGTATMSEFGRQRWRTGCTDSGTGAPTPTTPAPSGTPTVTPTPSPTPTPVSCANYSLCLKSVTAGNASLTFTWEWTRPSDFDDYPGRGFVYFEMEKMNSVGQWIPFYYLDSNGVLQKHLEYNESATTYTVTGLSNGQTYNVRMSGHYYKPPDEQYDSIGSNTGFQATPAAS